MLEYTYDEVTGRLWSDHFEGFCTGLRDLCDLDIDVSRSSVSMATYYQEYRIKGEKIGVERDDMPKFLADQGVANDLTRSRANPSNWILYLTEKEGLDEKFEELFKLDTIGAPTQEDDLVSTDIVVEKQDVIIEDAALETPTEDESIKDKEETVLDTNVVLTTPIVQEFVEDASPEPDFDYVKSLKDLDDGVELLKEYGTKFGIDVAGTNFKGCNISFRNKWKRMQKEKTGV